MLDMGGQATGKEFRVNWFSILKYNDAGKISSIFSISDVLTMLTDIGVLEERQPIDPYK